MSSTRRGFFLGLSSLLTRQASSGASADDRAANALRIRQEAALAQSQIPADPHLSNGDEAAIPNYIATFHKGLPQSQLGEVEANAYLSLLTAIQSGKPADFEKISYGSGRRFVDPQAAYAYHMEGADPHRIACPPPPAYSTNGAAAEMVELYWQALTRDVPFTDYASSALIRAAADDLSRFTGYGALPQPGQTPMDVVFRGQTQGDIMGPYISQFLWKSFPYFSGRTDQKYRVPLPGSDFLTSYPEWLEIQAGVPPWRSAVYSDTTRYICCGRDLAEWVHYDVLYQAYLQAALILLNSGPETVLDDRRYLLSPTNPYRKSYTQDGFATFGGPHVVDWLGRVSTAALKAAWCQKWIVHRRLRPEEFGGRVHHTRSGAAKDPIANSLLDSPALDLVHQNYGTWLLPQAFPEACPLHPSYPSGHATVAGASSTVLKAFFDESAPIENCVAANADGSALIPRDDLALTVGGEINKLAFNVAMGRNWAGIHYRSDALAGLQLGEEVAVAILRDLARTLNEDFEGFRFTRFDGRTEVIPKVS